MYGLQIKNGEEVNEISEYIGNLSGYDGINGFNPVVTAEPLSGYALAVDKQKIVLQNDDTYILREIGNIGNRKDWPGYYLFYPNNDLPKDRKLLARISSRVPHLYALDRVSAEGKKGQYGIKLDSRIFAPIQKPVNINVVTVKHSHWTYGHHVYDSSGDPDLLRAIEFNSDIENKFLDFDDLRRIVVDGGGKGQSSLAYANFEGNRLDLGYYSNLEQLPDVDMTIREYIGIR
jgi:hypothetical protein|nr:MAG TPA: hypothetical protein [Caudoviricetes sp.]